MEQSSTIFSFTASFYNTDKEVFDYEGGITVSATTAAANAAKPASIWRSKTFSILLTSSLFLTIGNKLYEIVLPLLMYELTHSSVPMATMRTAELLPNLLFAIFIGVIVDRVNKKKWVVSMVGAQVLLLFSLVFLFKSGSASLALYYMLGFLLMTFNYGYFNAQVSLMKLSVSPEHLTSANAKFTLVETLVSVMGPALSGLIFLLADLSDGIMITAFAYLLCLFLLSRLSLQETVETSGRGRFVHDLYEGWTAFRGNRSLWMISLFVVFLNCTMVVVSTTIIFHAKDVLHLSSSLLAIVLSASGVGGLLGSLVINRLRFRIGLGMIFGLSALLNSAAYAALYLFASISALVVSLFFIGVAISLYSTSMYTFRHEQTPTHLMGRISGITGTLFRAGMPLAMYASGWMMMWWGTSVIFLGAAIWNAGVFLIYIRTHLWGIH
ncbi:MFS transporter [Aneurinibacillus sp. BA2021]|nr:MFS transporter [Aneurinibacillus sp. BA2021]